MILKAIGKTPNNKNNKFTNIEPTPMMLEDISYVRMLLEFIHKSSKVNPSKSLPTEKTNLLTLKPDLPTIIWFGHSSYMIKYKTYTILVDPVLFGNASPLSFFGRPFAGTTIFKSEEIPDIDLLILTHDHYDHLSYKTLKILKNKIHKIIAPLGVSSYLVYWGFNSDIITELGWHQKTQITDAIKITAMPARHFSGRFIFRNKTLWASYVLELASYKLFLGGDSGYDGQFKIIGEKYGPFDLVILECGQYGKNWPYIHMFPEQTAKAAEELQTKTLLPVHWAKFILSIHAWNEPIKRLLVAAEDMPYKIITPKIGEAWQLNDIPKPNLWWNFE